MKDLSRPQKVIVRLIVVNLLLLAASAIWYAVAPDSGSVAVAAAKNKAMLDMNLMADYPFDAATIGQETAVSTAMSSLLAGKDYQFVNAVPLSLGEARPWQKFGCAQDNCAHVIYYNYTDGGTINGILNLDTNEVVGGWLDANARPGGSTYIVDKAMAIAAADPEVQATLGDIGEVDPAMVP
ncbi:MAG: hypothetical protein P8183_22580, partial [Anaerolineae bacterium]